MKHEGLKELLENLELDKEWALANEWEAPICLADDLIAVIEIIKELIDDQTKDLTYEEHDIVERVVHSTADPEYAKLVKISPDFVDTALKCFDDGKDILTDIKPTR